MEYAKAIVNELNEVMYYCSEINNADEIEEMLDIHPEWRTEIVPVTDDYNS